MSDDKLQRLAQAIVSRLDAEHAERSPKRQEQDVNRVLTALRDIAAAERERIAKLIDENADVYLKKTQETGDDVCAVYAVLQSRLAAKIRAMGDAKP